MRIPRILTIAATGLFHKMWRGHNREYVLGESAEKHHYLDALFGTYKDDIKESVLFHGYCLMGNHPHEIGRVLAQGEKDIKPAVQALGNWMRNAHSRFGFGYNRRHNRQGKVAYDRPKTKEIRSEFELLRTMFYADANPVRAGIVSHPANYQFSSYRFYAFGERNKYTKHLTPPGAFLASGKTAEQRRKKYRQLCDLYLRQEGLIKDLPSEDIEELKPGGDFETMLYNIRIRGTPLLA